MFSISIDDSPALARSTVIRDDPEECAGQVLTLSVSSETAWTEMEIDRALLIGIFR